MQDQVDDISYKISSYLCILYEGHKPILFVKTVPNRNLAEKLTYRLNFRPKNVQLATVTTSGKSLRIPLGGAARMCHLDFELRPELDKRRIHVLLVLRPWPPLGL